MILFTADWHIKLGQKNVPAPWAISRYHQLFEQIHSLEQACDLHIIGGDIFDRIPTMEELQLYFSFIRMVEIPTIIFDGNHEATRKNKTFLTQLQDVTESLNPLVQVCDKLMTYKQYGFTILPYCDLHKKGIIEKIDEKYPLFTHVRGEIPPHVKPEIDLDLLAKFDTVFAGDLHNHSNSQRNIVYPGSPCVTSFHRNEVKTGYILIDKDWSWSWHEFTLPQLLRKTVTSVDEMIKTDFHHTIYEIQGDIQDLAAVENTELLDKKIVNRNAESSLILEKDMSIEDELVEYLTYILEISEHKIPTIMGLYNDYTANVAME